MLGHLADCFRVRVCFRPLRGFHLFLFPGFLHLSSFSLPRRPIRVGLVRSFLIALGFAIFLGSRPTPGVRFGRHPVSLTYSA